MWRPLVTLLVMVLCCRSAAALDCTNKLVEADRVICASVELRSDDERMSHLITLLADFIDDKEVNEVTADQNRWRDEWVRSCEPSRSPAERLECLRSKALQRMSHLEARRAPLEAYHGRDEPIDVGGVPLVMKATSSPCGLSKLFIGDIPIMDCVYRIEPRARYRDDSVDALAFVANGGGAAYICGNFPMYVVAVRPGLAPDVVPIPDKHGNRHGAACLGVTRTPQGFRFGAAAQAGEDGWSQEWTPKDGLSPAVIRKFAPVAGTTMKNARGAVLHNEQFYRALQRFAEASGLSPEALLGDYALSSDDDSLRLDNPPVRFRFIDGCSGWYGPSLCSNPSNARALYDPQADRLFFMWAKKPEVTCSAAYHHNNTPGELESETFYPPLDEWPADVFDALKRSYCQPK